MNCKHLIQFECGQKVVFTDDNGVEFKGIVKEIVFPDMLSIDFDDGEEGTEEASRCKADEKEQTP